MSYNFGGDCTWKVFWEVLEKMKVLPKDVVMMTKLVSFFFLTLGKLLRFDLVFVSEVFGLFEILSVTDINK